MKPSALKWFISVRNIGTSVRTNILVAIIGLILIVTALVVVRSATDRMLDEESKTAAVEWADYLIANIADMNEIFAGQQPSPESIIFLNNASTFGNVFRYKFFDADGSLRLLVGEKLKFSTNGQSLQEERKNLAGKILDGDIYVHTKSTQKKGRPPVYSEAYVPVFENGALVGVVEVYVDLTEKAARFQKTFIWIGLCSAFLIALAFGIPVCLWLRSRQRQILDEKTKFLAHHDSLTGLPNRVQFGEFLSHALRKTASDCSKGALL